MMPLIRYSLIVLLLGMVGVFWYLGETYALLNLVNGDWAVTAEGWAIAISSLGGLLIGIGIVFAVLVLRSVMEYELMVSYEYDIERLTKRTESAERTAQEKLASKVNAAELRERDALDAEKVSQDKIQKAEQLKQRYAIQCQQVKEQAQQDIRKAEQTAQREALKAHNAQQAYKRIKTNQNKDR